VLLVKVGWRGGKTFGSEEGRDEKWIKERSWAGSHCTQLEPRVQILNLGRTSVEIMMLTWRRLLQVKFNIKTGRAT
jgi:hypothetical protein